MLIDRSKLSKSTIAKKAQISRTTLDNAIGGADIKISTIENLAKVLGVDSSVFFQDDDCDQSATQGGSNNTQIAGNANSVTTNASFDKAIDEIAAQRRVNEKSQEQIDRLLSIIEGMGR